MENFSDLLRSESLEIYSPLTMLVGGLLSLGLMALLKMFVRQRVQQHRLPSAKATQILSRFEGRTKMSYALVAFGALWMLQIIIERKL